MHRVLATRAFLLLGCILLFTLATTSHTQTSSAPETGESAESCCGYYIDGTIFHDLNSNGVQEGSEPGLSGWTIEILNSALSVIQTTTTDSNGDWVMSAPAGCGNPFYVRQVVQPGWTQTWLPSNGMYADTLGGCTSDTLGTYNFGNVVSCAPFAKTYTTDADFVSGTLDGVVTNIDQLELSTTGTTYEFAWIANAGEGTISKVSTITGNEVARYYTGPPDGGSSYTYLSPSRTVVDKDGNCWVANRTDSGFSSLTQILVEGGVDRNTNTTIETSMDTSLDGIIQLTEMLPWGQDERVSRHYRVGTGTGDNGARGFCLDKAGYLWVALYGSNRVIKVDPNLSTVTYQPDLTPASPPELANVSTGAQAGYGLALSCNGLIYGSTLSDWAFELDPGLASGGTAAGPAVTQWLNHPGGINYGITADANGIVWLANVSGPNAVRWDPGAASWAFTAAGAPGPGRGITVDFDGNVWMACNDTSNSITKYDPAGNFLGTWTTTLQTPVGIGAAQDENLVIVGQTSWDWVKHNKTSGLNIPLAGPQLAGSMPYTYSDFTGGLYNLVAYQQGYWTALTDGGFNGLLWNVISWNASTPPGTAVSVEARASSSLTALASMGWTPIPTSGVLTSPMPGRYIETRVRLELEVECEQPYLTPILYDLTVEAICDSCHFTFCPEDIAVPCESPLGASVSWEDPTFSGACDSTYTLICTPPSGSMFPMGQSTVTCLGISQANDDTVSCEFLVTVTGDCDDPVVTGACCDDHHNCVVTTEALCDQLGGIYYGDGSTCLNQQCEFSCLRPPQGLTAWWPMDMDISGQTPNLADPTAPGLVQGPSTLTGQYVSNAYSFSGTDRLQVLDTASIDLGTGDFSMDVWVRTTNSLGVNPIADKRDDEIPLTGYFFYLRDGYPSLQMATGGAWTNYETSVLNGGAAAYVADGNWHLIGVTVDRNNNTGIQFYVDGLAVGTTFNPTPHSASLNNSHDLLIGESYPIISPKLNFVGDMDELEIFRRELTATDMDLLWLADNSGKCREACYATDNATCCGGQGYAAPVVTICNYDNVAHVYSFGLSPQPTGSNCYGAGALVFTPQNGTVTVGPGQCVNIPIVVDCPSDVPFGSPACFQVNVFNHDTGRLFGCTGSVRRPAWWCTKLTTGGLVAQDMQEINPALGAQNFALLVAHIDPVPVNPVNFDFELRPVGPEGNPSPGVSVNGLAPGQPFARTEVVPPGQEINIPFTLEYSEHQPVSFDILQLWADMDMTGTLSPIGEMSLRSILSTTAGVDDDETNPDIFDRGIRPFRALPNPFSASGRIEFTVKERARVGVRAFDLSGRLVKEILPKRYMDPGVQTVTWDGTDGFGKSLPSGIYFLQLTLGSKKETVKVALVK